MTYMRLTLSVAAIALISACSGDDGLTRVRPRIATEPPPGTELVFDEVVLTRSKVDPIIVIVGNVGEGPLTLDSVTLEGEGASQFRVSSYPNALAPGQRGEL